MDVVPADTMSVCEEDPIFCGGGDHRLTYDILNIKRGFPNLCIYMYICAFSMCYASHQNSRNVLGTSDGVLACEHVCYMHA